MSPKEILRGINALAKATEPLIAARALARAYYDCADFDNSWRVLQQAAAYLATVGRESALVMDGKEPQRVIQACNAPVLAEYEAMGMVKENAHSNPQPT